MAQVVDSSVDQVGRVCDPGDKPANSGTKRCASCGKEKPHDAFSRYRCRRRKKTVMHSYCKSCRAEKQRARYRADPDYYATNRRKNSTPSKERARAAVRAAEKRGALVRPELCEDCGELPVDHAHHESYFEQHWLDVAYLCRGCHRRRHADHEPANPDLGHTCPDVLPANAPDYSTPGVA